MSTNSDTIEIKVGDSVFGWDRKQGTFTYEDTDAILFWITSAMKTFFDTIEEISGHDAASLVLETTGYRQGVVVGEFFTNISMGTIEAVSSLPDIYANAGWGNMTIKNICPTERKATFQLKNSWEYKINKAQGKNKHGSFLPGHFAGLLSVLFNENIWYKVTKSQLEGDEWCEFEYFPSDISVQQNIHELARRKESAEIQKLESVVEARTKELMLLVKELSSPIIPVLDGIVVVPLLGGYDEIRSEELIEKTLHHLPKYNANYLVIDLTGLTRNLSDYTVRAIHNLATSASLLGSESILVGISPELSMFMNKTDLDLTFFNCFSTLQHGIYFALAQEGRKIV